MRRERELEIQLDEWISYAVDLERDVEEFRQMLRRALLDNDALLKEVGYLHMQAELSLKEDST